MYNVHVSCMCIHMIVYTCTCIYMLYDVHMYMCIVHVSCDCHVTHSLLDPGPADTAHKVHYQATEGTAVSIPALLPHSPQPQILHQGPPVPERPAAAGSQQQYDTRTHKHTHRLHTCTCTLYMYKPMTMYRYIHVQMYVSLLLSPLPSQLLWVMSVPQYPCSLW